jgi:hypothetical protein
VTRHVIAYEGKPTILPATRLKPGALWLEHEGIPVTWNFDWEHPPIGYGRDLRRDESTGAVSMEFDLLPEGELIVNNKGPDDDIPLDYTFYADQLEEEWVEATEEDEAYRLITKARVRGLAITPSPVWTRSQKTQGP